VGCGVSGECFLETSGHIPHLGHLLFAHVVMVFFLARHVTFGQWTLAARHDCNFNIFCAAPSGHTVDMRHYGLF
jgi:hypothetical protein